jgi:hypothetical protein
MSGDRENVDRVEWKQEESTLTSTSKDNAGIYEHTRCWKRPIRELFVVNSGMQKYDSARVKEIARIIASLVIVSPSRRYLCRPRSHDDVQPR